MAVQRGVHPSAEVLKAFGLGKLNDSSSQVVMSHLDQCEDCRKEVASLSGDDFLHRLRKAQGLSSTAMPAKAAGHAARAPQPPAGQTPLSNLPPELAANQQYEILRELGRGGMGVVYLAKNKLMDRLEVLKILNKTLLEHPGAVERFLREIRAAAKLNHANVVAAYSALQMGELLAFAMEYVEGQDLASVVKSQGPLPVPHACFYVQQAAHGLQHAYDKGMVHRDIKPQNLILAREGKKHIVKVLDFGLAKATREKKDDTGLTGEGKMLGTPDYIAPEQTLDAAHADIRADIYSLGCTLYYLLSGHPPFSASSLGAMLLAHQSQEAKPLNLVCPEVPEELAAVVRRMMAKSLAKRYQTPLEVGQALAPFVKQGTTPKASPELSVGAVEAKPVIKMAAPVAPPPVLAAEAPKKHPEPANVWESLTEGSGSPVESRKSAAAPKPRPATVRERMSQKRWLIGGGIGVGVLLLALLGMWAGGVFRVKVKTADGNVYIELKNLPADGEVYVDGERVTVTWGDGGRKAEIRVKPGSHKVEVKKGDLKLEVKKDGFSVEGKELTFKDGEREIFTVRLLPEKPKNGDPPRKVFGKAIIRLGSVRIKGNGSWRIDGEDLVQESLEKWPQWPRIVFGDADWSNYDLTVRFKWERGTCGPGIIFHHTSADDYCVFWVGNWNNNGLEVNTWTGGQWGRKEEMYKWGKINKGEWYDVRIEVREDRFRCLLDRETLFQGQEERFKKGLIGLATSEGACRFCDIKVTSPDGTILWNGLPELPSPQADNKKPPPQSVKVLTPAEAARKEGENVTVQFLVKWNGVNGEFVELYSETEWHHDGCFFIRLSESIRNKFQELGIPDVVGHFQDKLIRVTGTVQMLRFADVEGTFPCIQLENTNHIQIVDPP